MAISHERRHHYAEKQASGLPIHRPLGQRLCVKIDPALNQPFGDWDRIFPDRAMTVAAVDRLVHHSTIFEMNVESYRRRTALERKQQGPGRPARIATPNNVGVPPRPEDQQ